MQIMKSSVLANCEADDDRNILLNASTKAKPTDNITINDNS